MPLLGRHTISRSSKLQAPVPSIDGLAIDKLSDDDLSGAGDIPVSISIRDAVVSLSILSKFLQVKVVSSADGLAVDTLADDDPSVAENIALPPSKTDSDARPLVDRTPNLPPAPVVPSVDRLVIESLSVDDQSKKKSVLQSSIFKGDISNSTQFLIIPRFDGPAIDTLSDDDPRVAAIKLPPPSKRHAIVSLALDTLSDDDPFHDNITALISQYINQQVVFPSSSSKNLW